MKCRRCGRENPSNTRRCMYCNTPFYGEYSNVNMPDNSAGYGNNIGKYSKKTVNIIIAAIVALVVIFIAIAGVYAVRSFAPRKSGFAGGGGGGGGVISTSNRPTQPHNDINVTLDGEDPDVEIYSFNTDTYDILVGETKTVTFTAEIFANIELSDTDVYVIDENNNKTGYMNDMGIDGDVTAGDGIYSLRKEFSADAQRNVLYRPVAKGVTGESVNICYYRVFNQTDFDEADAIADKIKEISQPFLNSDSSVDEDKVQSVMNAISDYLNTQRSIGEVASYNVSNNSVYIKLKSGYAFVFVLEISGHSSGNSNMRVASYAPYDGLRGGMESLYDAAIDGTAQKIDSTFEKYVFSSSYNYDLDEVSLDALKKMTDKRVIIWGGHGGYDDAPGGFGSCIMTGELLKNSITEKYSADIAAERILTNYSASGRNTYCVTGGFFDKYLGDIDGAFVYLSSCSSGKDMTDGLNHRYKLVQAFIRKGAATVVANSGTILSEYTYKMERDMLNRMCENSDGIYYTASEALDYAKRQNGQNDGGRERSRPVIFPQNSTRAANFRFKEPAQGYVAGNVKDAENGEAIKQALVRVYKDGEEIEKIRTDGVGGYKLKLNEGDYVLKITKGHYKSAKIAVTISENTTVYNETFLMLKVGINGGFANGTITDAVSGQNVGGVSVKMRFSWNNREGTVLHSTQTNENGYYEISYAPGIYTIEYSKDGYITGYKNIIIGIIDFAPQNAVISPEMPDDGNFRIVLSWSNMPRDLDSHLTGPMEDGNRFHLYYRYANTGNGNSNSEYYQLDLDNTDIVSRPSIPETTTIVTQLDGVYRYSVHDYTNRGNGGSQALAQSNATVNIYKGSVLVATYHVPPDAKGSIWTVFELSDDQITPINKIGNGYENDISKF